MGGDVPLLQIPQARVFTALPQAFQRRIDVHHDERKFGDSLRSKTDVAMVNETLCKVLCHNLVVLIHEMCELGIDPVFWSTKPTN